MPADRSNGLRVTVRLLRFLVKLNVGVGVAISALLVASLVNEEWVMTALGLRPSLTSGNVVAGARMVMAIGIVSVPVAHFILGRLLEIVRTVGDGDPFVLPNARRLRAIAWAILILEVLHLAVGTIAMAVSTEAQPLDLDWSFSLTRWLAVVMLFVLARVFEQGARMREELEGTV